MTARQWLWLIAVQSVWAGCYVAMKFAGTELPIGAVVVARYGLATLGYLPLVALRGIPRFSRHDWLLLLVIGTLNFAVSPSLQVAAMRYTQAIDVAILTALEPLLTVLLAALLLRERLDARTGAALALGVFGMAILSGVGGVDVALTRDRLLGNSLFVASMLFEVAVTVAGGRLARRYDPLVAMAVMKAIGFVTAGVFYVGVWEHADLSGLSSRAWVSLLYLGWGASLFAYTLWYRLLAQAPVHQVAMSLFVQPLVGTALGWFLAGETIGLNTLLGGAAICSALAWSLARRRTNTSLP